MCKCMHVTHVCDTCLCLCVVWIVVGVVAVEKCFEGMFPHSLQAPHENSQTHSLVTPQEGKLLNPSGLE